MIKKISITILTILTASLLLTGCGEKPPVKFETPITGWETITLPPDATWDRSSIAGPIESHWYDPNLTQEELNEFLLIAMPYTGWNESRETDSGFIFTNENGDIVEFNYKNEDQLLVLIEPAGTYN